MLDKVFHSYEIKEKEGERGLSLLLFSRAFSMFLFFFFFLKVSTVELRLIS